MSTSYKNRFQKFFHLLSEPTLVKYARQKDSNTFCRNRKMPLKDLLLCCLSKKGLTTVFEIRNYLKQKQGKNISLPIQGYLQQRKRLNPEVFSYLNREYLIDFYRSKEVKRWNGYMVLAIDGSKTEIPNSKENRERFGNSSNQHSPNGPARALVSGMYDVLNQFYIDVEIEHISFSETELAKRNLEHLKKFDLTQPILVIFDRGYPSIEFVDFLETQGIHYLFRLSSNDYIEERRTMNTLDEELIIKHSYPRLKKIEKKHPERYEELKKKNGTNVRILYSKGSSVNELLLMINISKDIGAKELADLYYQRWEIEKKYHTLKNKIKFESITGKASIYVYQDFWSQILVYNMMQDIRKSADKKVTKIGKQNRNKYPMHTNENIAIGLFKESMISILLESELQKRIQKLESLQLEMERYILPIRKLPSGARKKNISNKYCNNQKYSF